jgi:2-iminobutanoate/2-iminopropanoate deaminase
VTGGPRHQDLGRAHQVYLTYFPDGSLPARSTVGVNGLALGALIEVECQAYAGKK